jgi:hypothetical protein
MPGSCLCLPYLLAVSPSSWSVLQLQRCPPAKNDFRQWAGTHLGVLVKVGYTFSPRGCRIFQSSCGGSIYLLSKRTDILYVHKKTETFPDTNFGVNLDNKRQKYKF